MIRQARWSDERKLTPSWSGNSDGRMRRTNPPSHNQATQMVEWHHDQATLMAGWDKPHPVMIRQLRLSPHPVMIKQLRWSDERTPPRHDQATQMVGWDTPHPIMIRQVRWMMKRWACVKERWAVFRLSRQKIKPVKSSDYAWLPPIIGGGMVCIDAEGRFFPHVLSGSHATLATLTLHLARAEGPEQSQTRRTDPRRGRIFGFMFSRAWRGWQGRGHTTLWLSLFHGWCVMRYVLKTSECLHLASTVFRFQR